MFNSNQHSPQKQEHKSKLIAFDYYPYGQSTANDLLQLEVQNNISHGRNIPVAVPTGKELDILEKFACDHYEIDRLAQSIVDLYTNTPKRALYVVGSKDFLTCAGAYDLLDNHLQEALNGFDNPPKKALRLAVFFTVADLLKLLPPRVLLAKVRQVDDLSRKASTRIKESKLSSALPIATAENRHEASNYIRVSYEDARNLKPLPALILAYLRDITNYKDYALNITALAGVFNCSRLTIRKTVTALKEAGYIDNDGMPVNDGQNVWGYIRVPKSIIETYELTPAAILIYSFFWTRAGACDDGVIRARAASRNDARTYIQHISAKTYKRACALLREVGLIDTKAYYKINRKGHPHKIGCRVTTKQAPHLETDTNTAKQSKAKTNTTAAKQNAPTTYRKGADLLEKVERGGNTLTPRDLPPTAREAKIQAVHGANDKTRINAN